MIWILICIDLWLVIGLRSLSSGLKGSLEANDRVGVRIAKSIRAHQANAGA